MPGNDYADDETISDDDVVYRRVPINHPIEHIVWDPSLERYVPSSAAFTDSRSGHPMSVVLKSALDAHGGNVDEILEGHDGFALAELDVGVIRECGLGVAKDPIDGNPAHAVVIGNKKKSTKRCLAKRARWAIPLDLDPP